MDILVALNNIEIKNKIDEKYGLRVYSHDISYKEDVIEYLRRYNTPHVVITKLDLPGEVEYTEYIKTLKEINKKNKIIILVDNLSKKDKEFLFANEIFNIIQGNEVNIEVIYNQIETQEKIIYKTVYKENIEENKKIISVIGTNGAGKSFVSSILSKSIAQYTKNKVILISLDSMNPSIDIINNIKCSNTYVKDFVLDIAEDINNVYKYVTKSSSYDNLWYINSKFDMFLYKFDENYNKMLKNLIKKFDYIILDFPNEILKNLLYKYIKDEVIFVINPNYISLKQAKLYLEYISKNTKLDIKKIKIVVNKEGVYSLDIRQIKSILKNKYGYITIKFLKEIEAYINGMIYNVPFLYKIEIKLLNFFSINYNRKKYKKHI